MPPRVQGQRTAQHLTPIGRGTANGSNRVGKSASRSSARTGKMLKTRSAKSSGRKSWIRNKFFNKAAGFLTGVGLVTAGLGAALTATKIGAVIGVPMMAVGLAAAATGGVIQGGLMLAQGAAAYRDAKADGMSHKEASKEAGQEIGDGLKEYTAHTVLPIAMTVKAIGKSIEAGGGLLLALGR